MRCLQRHGVVEAVHAVVALLLGGSRQGNLCLTEAVFHVAGTVEGFRRVGIGGIGLALERFSHIDHIFDLLGIAHAGGILLRCRRTGAAAGLRLGRGEIGHLHIAGDRAALVLHAEIAAVAAVDVYLGTLGDGAQLGGRRGSLLIHRRVLGGVSGDPVGQRQIFQRNVCLDAASLHQRPAAAAAFHGHAGILGHGHGGGGGGSALVNLGSGVDLARIAGGQCARTETDHCKSDDQNGARKLPDIDMHRRIHSSHNRLILLYCKIMSNAIVFE